MIKLNPGWPARPLKSLSLRVARGVPYDKAHAATQVSLLVRAVPLDRGPCVTVTDCDGWSL
jgi:hypothetical protein